MVLNDTMILPNQVLKIPTYSEEKIQYNGDIFIDHFSKEQFYDKDGKALDASKEIYSIFPCILRKNENDEYLVYVKNNTEHEMCLSEGTPVAEASITSPSINYMQIGFNIGYENPNHVATSKDNCFMKPISKDANDIFYDLNQAA